MPCTACCGSSRWAGRRWTGGHRSACTAFVERQGDECLYICEWRRGETKHPIPSVPVCDVKHIGRAYRGGPELRRASLPPGEPGHSGAAQLGLASALGAAAAGPARAVMLMRHRPPPACLSNSFLFRDGAQRGAPAHMLCDGEAATSGGRWRQAAAFNCGLANDVDTQAHRLPSVAAWFG